MHLRIQQYQLKCDRRISRISRVLSFWPITIPFRWCCTRSKFLLLNKLTTTTVEVKVEEEQRNIIAPKRPWNCLTYLPLPVLLLWIWCRPNERQSRCLSFSPWNFCKLLYCCSFLSVTLLKINFQVDILSGLWNWRELSFGKVRGQDTAPFPVQEPEIWSWGLDFRLLCSLLIDLQSLFIRNLALSFVLGSILPWAQFLSKQSVL